ncbi:hypothetical protein BU14_0048s0023 [Porphyra umbilicalis]|uniref:molybdopterin adenylyltransferase n=1 Tax=Porphyra umbilicalis TaxID=2786 RepID=A0A1X6PIT4_PORUM|nr:hypothetical protein BU14_0048s0023 [Porphyra umbilicalis]|eukprot:OSX80608.1 hypothetical protein BU14_0048s0023 [Porphyra umbilicalis]
MHHRERSNQQRVTRNLVSNQRSQKQSLHSHDSTRPHRARTRARMDSIRASHSHAIAAAAPAGVQPANTSVGDAFVSSSKWAHYSRSPKNPALNQLQKRAKSASTTPQKPIWNYFATVGVRDLSENGCRSNVKWLGASANQRAESREEIDNVIRTLQKCLWVCLLAARETLQEICTRMRVRVTNNTGSNEERDSQVTDCSLPPPVVSLEALGRLRSALAPLPPVRLPLAAALHHTLVKPIVAGAPQPPFAASTRDGYAVATADGPGTWPVVARLAAGAAGPPPPLDRGTVAYITTGAAVPAGADAVVMVEDVDFVFGADDDAAAAAAAAGGAGRGGRRAGGTPLAPGTHIRPVGSDVAAGEVLVPVGARLTPAAIGVAAAAGVTAVTVTRMPVVGVLSTGNELTDAGGGGGGGGGGVGADDSPPPPAAAVLDANRPTLLASLAAVTPACSSAAAPAATAAGSGGVIDYGIVRDEADAVAAAVATARDAVDVLITSGGVSMGDADHVKPALAAAGTILWGRVAIKPGKPLTAATLGRRGGPRPSSPADDGRPTQVAVGLPGNPASAFVGFHLVVRSAIDVLSGGDGAGLPRVDVTVGSGAGRGVARDRGRLELVRATVAWRDGGYVVVDGGGGQQSSRLTSAVAANALLLVEPGEGVVGVGERLPAYLL